jgi:hypothetical protein
VGKRTRLSRAGILAGFGLLLLLAGCAAEPLPPPPMPPDLRVVPPPPGVSREHARYSGRWIGKWDGVLEHVLVVELEVEHGDATEVVAVYSWGVAPSLGVGQPGWVRVRGRIENGALRLDLSRLQSTALYILRDDGTLEGQYWRLGTVMSRARMTRSTSRDTR